jgi:phosphonate transport system substrate-binding protein
MKHITRVFVAAVFSTVLLLALGAHPVTAQELTFATYPFGDSDTIYRAFLPTVEHLAAELGVPVRLVVTRDYEELSDRLVDGTVDIAWIGSANYVKTRERLPSVRYVATYMERSLAGGGLQPYYQSVILTRSDLPYRSLEDLGGTRFGFTSPDSTSGYAYPRMILANRDIQPEDFFGAVYYLGRHIDVINALRAGSLDAGAVSDGTYHNAVEEYGEVFTVLEWSEQIPLDAIVTAPGVSAATAGAIGQILTEMPESHPAVEAVRRELGWPAAGFEVRSDSFYDSVERALGYTSGQ